MKVTKLELSDVSFPVFLWYDGFACYVAEPIALCVLSRSGLTEWISLARRGEMHMADAAGRCFDVSDWAPIKPFGGIGGLFRRLIGGVFSAPVLTNETRPTLEEFKLTLSEAVRARHKYDRDEGNMTDDILALRKGTSYAGVIGALEKSYS